MKANMINTNSVMKTICAVVVLLGMSVSAWGTDDVSTITTSSFNGLSKYWSADNNASDYEATRGAQWTTNAGTTFTATNFTNVSSISIQCAKSNTGTGTITITAGANTKYITSFGTTNTTETLDLSSSPYTGTITINVNATNKSLYMKSITVTYTPVPYTVTFEKEGGEFDDPSVFINTNQITEASGGAGITLPLVNPSASMEAMGWGFYGWAASAVGTPTETAPTIVGKAGDTYYPSGATTLHAVFAKGEYTKVTSTSEITSGGKYLIAGWYDSKVHVMTSTYVYTDDYYMKEKVITESSVGKISAASIIDTWRYIITGTPGSYFIQNVITNKYIDTYYTDWYEHNYDSDDSYTIAFSDGQCSIKNNYASCSYPYLMLFAEGDFGTVDEEWAGMLLYKETVTPTYCSNPSTVKLVASPAAGGTVVFDDNSSAEMDFATDAVYTGDITATPNSGYDFLNWVSSDESAAVVGTNDDPTTGVVAEGSATITANFYQRRSITYTLTGVDGDPSNPTTVTKDEMDAFVSGFDMQAHYKDMTLVSVTMGGSPMTEGEEADYEWEVDDGTAMLTIHHTNIDGDIVITVSATLMEYTKYAFSCSELTLTPHLATTGTPIFITSAAGKTVRSQDYIEITGNGLTPSTALTFPSLPSKFAIKNADGTAVTTDVNGEISTNAYIFYTPGAGDTSDGLDKLTGITVSVGGAKPKTVVLTQDIIGRHLPANFVIAAKRNGKWYAIPSNMTMAESTTPVEIAVDDANNPTIAYTATTNNYSLYDQALSTGVKLAMHGQSDAPLAASPTTTGIGKSSATVVTNNQADNYLWLFAQTNTEVATAAEAKYTMKSLGGYNNYFVRLKENAGNPIWGQYDSGISELRLIPASDIVFTEAYFVEWAQHGGVIEVDAQGVAATSVVAHLNGASSAAITLVQTKAGDAKNNTSKYNYTVNFGDGIDFAAAASNGAMLTLEWKNGATTKAVSNIVVPKIVASDITINKANYPLKSDWNTEVHVLPGKTVTVDADYSPNPDVTIKELNIYPGATVVASTGTLIATTLVLRNGWSRAGTKKYDVARLHVTSSTATLKATNVYADWYIDYDQYYPIAVPWNAIVANFTYRYCTVDPSVGHDKNIRLRYYDGASRATNIQEGVGSGANWKLYGDAGCASVPGTLTPSTGYAMTAKRPSGKAFSIIRMPLTLPSGTWGDGTWTTSGEQGTIGEAPSDEHKDQVAVTAYGVKDKSETAYAEGWNFIANPYMSLHQGALSYNDESGDVIEYANVPDINFKEYDQLPIETTKLKPASAFLVQVPKTGTVTFDTGHRKASAPSYRTEEAPQASKQKAYILLSDEEANDMMGLIISDQYTAEYEMNADLEKLLGDGTSLRTYMRYGDRNMAYVAINEMLAKEWIPVTVRIPESGEYTYSLHEVSKVSELEGVYLIDYQNGDKVTNLIEQSYTFSSTAGTINGRFSINAKAGERQTPTGIDAINAGGDINSDKPFKFIYHDKVYIWLNGVIYDTTGKRVK